MDINGEVVQFPRLPNGDRLAVITFLCALYFTLITPCGPCALPHIAFMGGDDGERAQEIAAKRRILGDPPVYGGGYPV